MPRATNASGFLPVERTLALVAARFFCAVLAACLTTGCNAKEESSLPLSLVASGDTGGWIVPCGCTANQSGGLLRRGSYLDQLRKDREVIYVDVGGAPSGTSQYDRIKFEAILRGEIKMNVQAHNIGKPEALLGESYLREMAEKLRAPFITCNVRDSAGNLLGDAYRIVNAEADGRRLAVLGVLSNRQPTGKLQIDPPRTAVLSTIEQIEENYDWLVVLAYLPEDELVALAENLPEADVVIGAATGQSIAPRRFGPTLVVSATKKGKFLASLVAPSSQSIGWDGEIVELDKRFSDDPQQKKNLHAFYDTLAERDLRPAETSFGQALPASLPEGFQIAGTDTCRDCHADDCAVWESSGHARAWESLTNTGAQVDSYCQQCHSTGFGLPGGFVSVRRSPNEVAVGCESCHGPSQGHTNDPQVHTSYVGQARNQCLDCHDRENSPEFVLDEYWDAIRHGTSETAASGASASEPAHSEGVNVEEEQT